MHEFTNGITKEKNKEFGWKILEHPPYSPNISPFYIFLFVYLKSELK